MQESAQTNPCPRCSHQNTADTDYCGNCGLSIDGLCPTCGTQNANSTHYCGNCGLDFVTPAPREPSTAPASTDDLRSQHVPVGTGAPVQGSVPPQFGPASVGCPRCHHTNEPGAAFCFNCGLPFDAATGFSQRPLSSIPAFVGVRPGGFWYRVLASFIDDILTSGAVLFLIVVFVDVSVIGYFSDPLVTSFAADLISWASLLYAPVLLGIWSTTVGKRALNMYVLKVDGSPVGFWRALGREVTKRLMALPFGLTFWFVAFREDKRALHDLIAGTVVVQQ